MPGKTIYPSIPQAGNDLPSMRVAIDAMRQTLTMLIMNAQNPSANFTPSTASQIFVTHEDLKKTGVVGPQGPTGPQGPPGPGIAEAPNDVNTYGRHALSWVPVTSGGGGGIGEAPNDATAYARKSLDWSHITHTDITDWTATLAPYALTTALGSYLPLSGGSLTGRLTATSLAVNAATVAATVPIYGSIAGAIRWGIFLGNGQAESGTGNSGSNLQINSYTDAGATQAVCMTINRNSAAAYYYGSFTVGSGNLVSQASGSGNAQLSFQNNAGNTVGFCYWDAATNSVRLYNASGANIACLANGFISLSGAMQGRGVAGLQGSSGGSYGSNHNWFWSGGVIQAWVDTTNVGTVAFVSDYRIKKDVEDLPSMWERAKTLRPISYTHQDYFELDPVADQGEVEPRPLVVGDDEERWGFIAHELQESLIPSAATGTKDERNLLQSPNPWTIIATLTKALQEAMTRIEALEAAR